MGMTAYSDFCSYGIKALYLISMQGCIYAQVLDFTLLVGVFAVVNTVETFGNMLFDCMHDFVS